MYHVRVGLELKDWWLTWVNGNSPKYVLTEEIGSETEGVHYHCVFEYAKKKDNIRKYINSELVRLELKGERGKENKYYGGLKDWNEDISYVLKDGKVIASVGYSEEEIQSKIEEGRTKYKEKKPVQVKLKQDKKSLIEELIEQCVQDLKASHVVHYEDAVWAATRFFLKAYKGRIDDYRLTPMVRSVLYQLGGISQAMVEQRAARNMFDKLVPYRGAPFSLSETGTNLVDTITHE